MRTDEMSKDPVMGALAELPICEPDQRRAERMRARCHAAIERQLATDLLLERAAISFSRWILEPALVAILSAVFLIEVARRALQLYAS
jgi:hypothetical protein